MGVEHYMPFLTALLQTCGESTLDRTFLWVHYKKHNNYGLHFNGTNISCILAIFLSLAAKLKKKKTFMAPFYGWGSTVSRLEPLQGGSLLFPTKFPEIPGTHFVNLKRMKG